MEGAAPRVCGWCSLIQVHSALQELNIEEQCCIGRNGGGYPLLAVREVRRDAQRALATDLHPCNAQIPAPDHLAATQSEVDGAFIELLAVCERASILYVHLAPPRGKWPAASLQVNILEPTLKLDRLRSRWLGSRSAWLSSSKLSGRLGGGGWCFSFGGFGWLAWWCLGAARRPLAALEDLSNAGRCQRHICLLVLVLIFTLLVVLVVLVVLTLTLFRVLFLIFLIIVVALLSSPRLHATNHLLNRQVEIVFQPADLFCRISLRKRLLLLERAQVVFLVFRLVLAILLLLASGASGRARAARRGFRHDVTNTNRLRAR
mmetsp:Transcript_24915/g.50040  ORF Transcript_24915/g.50040 Transcript_24915/m.50040 type:complete len:318 (-) Transcript_24915:16-969(-)